MLVVVYGWCLTIITGTHCVGGQISNGHGRLSSSVVVVCNSAGRRVDDREPGAWTVGRPTLHSGPVRLRPVRATPCFLKRTF